MILSLRSRFLLAFALVAGLMGTVTILAVTALRQQGQIAVSDQQALALGAAALSDLRAANLGTEAAVLTHLRATSAPEKARAAATLVALETMATLARARLEEQGLAGDLAAVSARASDLRQAVMTLSDQAPLGEAQRLVLEEIAPLRARILTLLRQMPGLAAEQAQAALDTMGRIQTAVLMTPIGPTEGQLTLAVFARADLSAALARLPQGRPLQVQMTRLLAADARVEAIIAAHATPLLGEMIKAQGRERKVIAAQTEAQGRAQTLLAQTAAERLAQWQRLLVLVTNSAIVLGFAGMIIGLRTVGSGLEAAVRLAEKISASEAAAPAWVQRNLAGRLTAALVRLSGGQTAVAASLDAVLAGRPPRPDLPDLLRPRFVTLAHRLTPPSLDPASDLLAMTAQDLRDQVQTACVAAMGMGQDAAEIGAALEDELAEARVSPAELRRLQNRMEGQALGLERQAANLAQAGHLAELLAATFAVPVPQSLPDSTWRRSA